MRQPTTWWDQEDSLDTDYCINRGSAVLQGLWELGNLIHVYNRLAVRLLHFIVAYVYILFSGFGGLGVACWPLVPKFADSNSDL